MLILIRFDLTLKILIDYLLDSFFVDFSRGLLVREV